MIDYDLPELKRMGENKNVLVISSLVLDDPDCDVLFAVADALQDIANELCEYGKDKI